MFTCSKCQLSRCFVGSRGLYFSEVPQVTLLLTCSQMQESLSACLPLALNVLPQSSPSFPVPALLPVFPTWGLAGPQGHRRGVLIPLLLLGSGALVNTYPPALWGRGAPTDSAAYNPPS